MATRFYFQASNAPTVSPPIDAGWANTATFVRRIMGTGKNAGTETVAGTVADNTSALSFQLVSPPLAAQTFTGTVTIVSRAREVEATDNINKRVRAVRVYASDGSTLRGTLSPFNQTSSPSELNTTFEGQLHAQNNGIGTITVQDGDIIVVEVGFGMSGTVGDGNNQWETVLGGTGTDHAAANGDTTGTVPWIEFSANLTFIAAAVTLTPATATLTAQSNTSTPGAVTRALTTATATVAGRTLTATPGSVTVALSPATGGLTAVAGSPAPLAVNVSLTPAVATTSARVLTPSPGTVTTSVQPGLVALAARTVTAQPLAPNVNLTAAAATVAARATTAVPGLVTVALTRATSTLTAVAATGVQPGLVTVALSAAVVPVGAQEFGLTPGEVTVTLVAAAGSWSPRQLTPAGIGSSSITLTPATATLAGLQVTAHPGLVLAPLTRAPATWAGVTLGLTPGPVTMVLSAATVTSDSVSISAAPGAVTTALTSADADWAGVAVDGEPGPVSTDTSFADAVWSAVAVSPAKVQGVLLRPALANLIARKVNPVGSVLPLNVYELPLAKVLLDSLREVLINRTDNPPMHFALRTGETVAHDLSQNEDLCCEGLAYVKINRVYASTNFPEEDEDWFPCGPLGWAADLEMGILRCAPVGDVNSIPTDSEWADATELVANDSAAMRLALQNFADRIDPLTDWRVQGWLPFGPAGACTGGTQVVTVGWIPC